MRAMFRSMTSRSKSRAGVSISSTPEPTSAAAVVMRPPSLPVKQNRRKDSTLTPHDLVRKAFHCHHPTRHVQYRPVRRRSMVQVGEGTKFWHRELSNIGDCVIGRDCVIHSHVWIGDGVVIGDRVRIEAFAFIPPGVTIGDDVFIGPRATFTNDRDLKMDGSDWIMTTIVANKAKIGAGAVIVAG